MTEATPRQGSLVLYKAQPARVKRAEKKLEIALADGQVLSVRPKDVVLIHPGPVDSLVDLDRPAGEMLAAWELLAGSTTSLADLADLAYGAYEPSTAWAAWSWVADGLYFQGTPELVVARTPEEVAAEQKSRQARLAEEQAWAAFLERAGRRQLGSEDGRFVRDLEELAMGRAVKSRVMRELGRPETAEAAHTLLLELGAWDHSVNPYPSRLGVPTSGPQVPLPDLPATPRRDLTHLAALAIDDEGNQEPDDAVSLEGSRLWVHVADVAALVPAGSPADLEARARGSTLFLPEGTVPMLPWTAVERLGLGLAAVSPALSFGLDLEEGGKVAGVEVVPSWVRVTRLTYEQAEARLGEEPFCALHHLARTFRERRLARGAVAINLPEVKIWLDNGQVQIRPILPLRSRDLVTEAMLTAGEAVARFCLARQIPIPFTTQDLPATDERPDDLAGMFGLRRYLRPSEYSSLPLAHGGLGLPAYVQATSPLRRYLDLVVHQQLRAHLLGGPLLDVQGLIERVGATAAMAGSVRQAERLARRHWTLVYLMQHPGWQGEGVVVEQQGRQATLVIPDLDLDTRIHTRRDLALNASVRLAFDEARLPRLEARFRMLDV